MDNGFTPYIFPIAIFLIFFAIGMVSVIKNNKKRKEYISNTYATVTPRNGIVVDILVYKHIEYDGEDYVAKWDFYPIIKDDRTGKIYVSFKDYSYSEYRSSYSYFLRNSIMKYKLKSKSGKDISIGDRVNIYINKELDLLKRENDNVIIDGKEYKYIGKIDSVKVIDQKGDNIILNAVYDDFLRQVDRISLFEGVIDFDIDKMM